LKIKDLVTPEHPDGTRAYFNHYIVFRIEILRQLDINFWVVVGYYDHIVLQSFYNERNGQEYNFNRTINDDSLRMQYDWSSGRDIGESETLLFKVGVQSTLYMHSNDCEFTTINSYTAQIEQVSASIITA
jgi:hypothetical protein